MPLTDAFSNTSPVGITPSRGTAFSNDAVQTFTPSRGTAFNNSDAVPDTLTLGNAFSNVKADGAPTGEESFTARAQATANTAPASVIAGAFVDFVQLSDGDLVLLANQNNSAENGLYLVNGAGAAAIRATDHRFGFTVRVGPFGNVNRNKAYSYKPVFNYVVGTSAVTFTALVAEGRTV